MKLITCAGYYATGSSAITDLINECDNVHFMGDYEFRFIQDPDGIADLEYNLVLNNHRHNSGYAIKRYERNVAFLAGNRLIKKYNRYFDDQWKALSAEYVKKLVDVEYKGYWHQDLRDKGKVANFIERAVNKILHGYLKVPSEMQISLFLKNNTNYASYPGESFYQHTRDYIDALFSYANKDGKEYVMADQLVPPSNVTGYLKYFNDLKVVVVERDPRDLYLLEKLVYHGTIIPHDPKEFVLWYKATRAHKNAEQDDSTRVLRIDFEDLIFHYDEFSKKILDFCGIDPSHHTNPKTLLDPARSVKNTQLYKNYPEEEAAIAYISKELKEYLYDFDNV